MDPSKAFPQAGSLMEDEIFSIPEPITYLIDLSNGLYSIFLDSTHLIASTRTSSFLSLSNHGTEPCQNCS